MFYSTYDPLDFEDVIFREFLEEGLNDGVVDIIALFQQVLTGIGEQDVLGARIASAGNAFC